MSYNLVNPTTADLTRVAGGTLYADNPIGSIIPFGSSTIPSGYLLCNGQAVSRTTYSELFAAIGTAFGTGDGSTTFNVPDMRESVPKGAGLTGKTVGAHLDEDGLAVGEFLDDQIQNIGKMKAQATSGYSLQAGGVAGYINAKSDLRTGNTTEVKAVGVNYIIKAKHVGIPADFIDAIDDAISDTTVDTVADGNMHPVTSNAVYDELNKVETIDIASLCTDVISCEALSVWATKSGRVVTLRIQITNAVLNTVSDSYDTRTVFTLPAAYRPRENMLVTWLGQALNDAYCGDIRTDGLVHFWQWGSHTAPGTRSIVAQVTYII